MLFAQIDEGILTLVKTISEVGFAGAFGVAAWLCFWLIRARREDWQSWFNRLIALQEEMTQVIRENTAAFANLAAAQAALGIKIAEMGGSEQKLFEKLLERPCLLIKDDPEKIMARLERMRLVWLDADKGKAPCDMGGT